MRGLLSSKTIASNTQKKSSARIARQLPSLHNNELTFEKINMLIVPCDYLPINIEIDDKDHIQTQLLVTHETAILKQKQNVSIPINIQKQRWLKLNFGQEYRRVSMKLIKNNRRYDKNSIYTDIQNWRQTQKQQLNNCYLLSFQSILMILRVKIPQRSQRKSQIGYKNSISSFMKTKFSQKGNIKHNNIILKRIQHNSIRQQDKKQISNIDFNKNNKKDSQTLELQYIIDQQKRKQRRDSNTSTSIRIQNKDNIKFSRRIKKLRDFAQSRNVYSQKQTTYIDDNSQIFPENKIKPRFYQHINLSQEEIDIKRKKFDSQFITKKSIMPLTSLNIPEKQPNQSQVTQDICKMEASKPQLLQDTLERGIEGGNQQNNGANIEQSGTLCQSVYE